MIKVIKTDRIENENIHNWTEKIINQLKTLKSESLQDFTMQITANDYFNIINAISELNDKIEILNKVTTDLIARKRGIHD
jgi:hypothetical protein